MPSKRKSSSSPKRVNRKVRKTLRRAQPKFGFTQENAHGQYNSLRGIGPHGFVGPQPRHEAPDLLVFDDPFEDVTMMSTWSFKPTYHGGEDERFTTSYAAGPGPVFDTAAREEYDFAGNRMSDINRAVGELAGLQSRLDYLSAGTPFADTEREHRNNMLRELPEEEITGDLLRRLAPGILAEEGEVRTYPSGTQATNELRENFVYETGFSGVPSTEKAIPTLATTTFGSNVEMFRLPEQPPVTGFDVFRPRNETPHLGAVSDSSSRPGMNFRAPPEVVRVPPALGVRRSRIFTEQLDRERLIPPPNMFPSQEYRAPMGPVYLDHENTETLGRQLSNAPYSYELNPNKNPAPPATIKGALAQFNATRIPSESKVRTKKARKEERERIQVHLPRKVRNHPASSVSAYLQPAIENDKYNNYFAQGSLFRGALYESRRRAPTTSSLFLEDAPPVNYGPTVMGESSLAYIDDEEPLVKVGTKRTIKQPQDVKRQRTMKTNNKRIREPTEARRRITQS